MFHVILSGDYWEGGTAQRPEHRWNASAQKLSALVRRCFFCFFRGVVFFGTFLRKEETKTKRDDVSSKVYKLFSSFDASFFLL